MPTATPIATTTPGSWLPKAVLEIGDATFAVEIANTPQSRARGLGFRDSLPEGRGMWFEYETPRLASFWMRGMRFPLDMVWIDANLRVVGVTADVPHAPPGHPGLRPADLFLAQPRALCLGTQRRHCRPAWDSPRLSGAICGAVVATLAVTGGTMGMVPRGAVVAQQTLDLLTQVRILAGQPGCLRSR